MYRKISAICTDISGLACLVLSLITENVEWVIAAAIFKVAANTLEE